MAPADHQVVAGFEPLDVLAGLVRLVELIARLDDTLGQLRDPRPIDGRRDAIIAAADRPAARCGSAPSIIPSAATATATEVQPM